jgi:hypothetical protein
MCRFDADVVQMFRSDVFRGFVGRMCRCGAEVVQMFRSDVQMCRRGADVHIRCSDQKFKGWNGCADVVQMFSSDVQMCRRGAEVQVGRENVQRGCTCSYQMFICAEEVHMFASDVRIRCSEV